MELDQPTPVSSPPSIEWHPCTALHTHNSKVFSPSAAFTPQYAAQCTGAIQGKEGRIQLLAAQAPSRQAVASNITVIHEQSKNVKTRNMILSGVVTSSMLITDCHL